jgi:hypothetical protein
VKKQLLTRVLSSISSAFWGLACVSCASSSGTVRAEGINGISPREAGCAIELVREGLPARAVRLLSHVRARCTGDIAADRARCERLLMDEGCRRGAVVLWQLRETPLRDTEDGIQLEAAAGIAR